MIIEMCREDCIVKTVILACNTIRDELEKVAHETKCKYPFVWIESGLHLKPGFLTPTRARRAGHDRERATGAARVRVLRQCVIGLHSGELSDLSFPKSMIA